MSHSTMRRGSEVPTKRVSGIQFGILSPEELHRLAVCTVTTTDTYNQDGTPVKNGVYDRRMGVMNNDEICETCNQGAYDCPGHFGEIVFYIPIIQLGYMQQILYVLRHVCLRCSRLTMTSAQMRAKVKPETIKKCSHCNAPTTNIFQGKDENKSYKIFSEPREITTRTENDIYEIAPATIREIFLRIRDVDIPALGMSQYSHPASMILTRLPVPPISKRPSTHTDDKAKENEETKTLLDIIKHVETLRREMEARKPYEATAKHVMHLVNNYLDSGSIGGKISKKIQSLSHNKKIKGIINKLGQKEGIIRNHIMGKRVDFCSRSVISPDPSLNIDECGLPLHVVKVWYIEETINRHNIQMLQAMVYRGINVYPAVTHVKSAKNGTKIAVSADPKQNEKITLQFGDKVSRQAMAGDMIIFNRQPTLHRMGILGMRIVVFPYETMRFNPSNCPCFNADFDGDEMNAHLIRNPLPRAEAEELMLASKHMISPKYGTPIIGAVQDGLYGIYKLSIAEKITGPIVMDLLVYCENFDLNRDSRAVFGGPFKISGTYTGRQVISAYLYSTLKPEFNYRSTAQQGDISVERNIMKSGVFNKAEMGSGKGAFLHAIHNKYGSEIAANFLVIIQQMGIKYNNYHGATISYSDMIIPEAAKAEVKEIYTAALIPLQQKLYEAERGLLTSGFGRTPGIEYENNAISICGSILEQVGKIPKKYMVKNNNFAAISLETGSKGSGTNMTQVAALVGQNNISGRRPELVFDDRSTFHCPHGTEAPEWRGFISKSYVAGLDPIGSWWHYATGRDGLKDKVLGTRSTGYTAKKLVKLTEDVRIMYDMSVRTMYEKTIQWNYSGDSLAVERTVPHKIELITLNNEQIYALTKIPAEQNLLIDYRTKLRSVFFPLGKSNEVQIQLPCLMRDILLGRSGGTPIVAKTCFEMVKMFTDEMPHLYCGYTNVEHFEAGTVILRSQIHYYLASERVIAAGISHETLRDIIAFIKKKFIQAMATPGEMIGPIVAQSIAETGTQLTLDTFHHLGSAKQKAGLLEGTQRLDEILRAAKKPKTPYTRIYLKPHLRHSKENAKILASQLEFTNVGDLIDNNNIKTISDPHPYDPEKTALIKSAGEMISDKEIIADYLKNTYGAVPISGRWVLRFVFNRQMMIRRKIRLAKIASVINREVKKYHAIHSDDNAHEMVVRVTLLASDIVNQYQVDSRVDEIKNMIVSGIPGISNVEIREDNFITENSQTGAIEYVPEFYIDCDGSNIAGILTLPMVDEKRIYTNDIKKAEAVLGFEIARRIGIIETTRLLTPGNVNPRIISLLHDFMIHSGTTRSIDRAGQRAVAGSTIGKLSFEETATHLKTAAIKGEYDSMKGSSSNIMMAQSIKGGTGMFEIAYNVIARGLSETDVINAIMQ